MGKERHRRSALPLIRLHILAEGQTEVTFAREILAPELANHNIFLDTQKIRTGRKRGIDFRGGLVKYEHLAGDLTLRMKDDQNFDSWFTTMIDLYRLPSDFPGIKKLSAKMTGQRKAAALQMEMHADITLRLNQLPVCQRFVPYIQVHEYEAVLFSDPSAFSAEFPSMSGLAGDIQNIRSRFVTPEDINDVPSTAPSKRIHGVCPDYVKAVNGILIAKRIGLPTIRRECPHFNAWFESLLALTPATSPPAPHGPSATPTRSA